MIGQGFKHLLSYSGMERFLFCFSRHKVKTDSVFPQVYSQHWTYPRLSMMKEGQFKGDGDSQQEVKVSFLQ